MTKQTPPIVDRFLERYAREFDFFEQAARICREECQKMLREAGIRAMVTSRAKNPASLRGKLVARHSKKPYTRTETIYADLVDLAGVRVALYFPGDRDEVAKLISERFVLDVPPKVFPEDKPKPYPRGIKKKGPGYIATHFRMRMPGSLLPKDHSRFSDAIIEIQVASVLMHAWAEVEHDLVYKPRSGELSDAEYRILDDLNLLVVSGEGNLENLQFAGRERVLGQYESFGNHYELAAFLHRAHRGKAATPDVDAPMGRADVLLRFLERLELNAPKDIEAILHDLEGESDRPIVEQIVDLVLSRHPDSIREYEKVVAELSRNPYASSQEGGASGRVDPAFHAFMARWIVLERGLEQLARERGERIRPGLDWRTAMEALPEEVRNRLGWLRRLRNAMVHGLEIPDERSLASAIEELDVVLRGIVEQGGPEVNEAMARVWNQLNR